MQIYGQDNKDINSVILHYKYEKDITNLILFNSKQMCFENLY